MIDRFEAAFQTGSETAQLIQDFRALSSENRIAVWTSLTQQGLANLPKAIWCHKHLARWVLEIFGVPMGLAGVGVQPKKIVLYNEWSKRGK